MREQREEQRWTQLIALRVNINKLYNIYRQTYHIFGSRAMTVKLKDSTKNNCEMNKQFILPSNSNNISASSGY